MEKLAAHICEICGEEGDVICSEDEWDLLWHNICDPCAHKQMREESGNSRPYRL